MDLDDPVTGLRAEVFYRILDRRQAAPPLLGAPGEPRRAAGHGRVGDLVPVRRPGAPGRGPDDLADLDLLWAENDWMAEGRWQVRPLRDALPDINRRALGADPRGCFGLTSAGTWSSGRYLPAGAVVNRRTGHAWAWQIEHNGGWHWQVGECTRRRAAAGPGRTAGMPRRARSAAPISRSSAPRTPSTTGGSR